ncbi:MULTISPECIES: ABC transporter permease [Kosakonia]|uniref:ABC transporter permease n=1 Tax=Kosakonia TaxID=1330547 RepID=UPI0005ED9ECC|nr:MULTISPECIES: ABC transporter permease [Kosakonia]RCW95917.1 putative ABC transport system permease protein [Kosakonia sp. AG348]
MSDLRLPAAIRVSKPSRYGMPWLQLLLESLDNLRLLGRRAVLALLGIAVGCAAVVALLNIGYNAEREAMSIFRGMGSELLVANIQQPVGSGRKPLVAPADLDIDTLHQRIPEIDAASALVPSNTQARFNGRTAAATLVGSGAELPSVLRLQLEQGRFLSRFDAQSTYAVLGANVAAQWAQPDRPVLLGDRIQIGGYLFEIVGILRPQGPNPIIPVSVDDAILLPITGMRRVISFPQITGVAVRSRSGEELERIAPRLQAWLSEKMPGFEVNVQVPQQLLEGIEQQSRLFSWLLAGLGGISLLVGGVGVMNVMVMNVSERRREIGVRMALGARPRDIAMLFLLEAIVLATVGALLGAAAGLAAAWLFVWFSGWSDFALSAAALPLGIGSAIVIGLFFGLSPALAASRLEPVEALRDA